MLEGIFSDVLLLLLDPLSELRFALFLTSRSRLEDAPLRGLSFRSLSSFTLDFRELPESLEAWAPGLDEDEGDEIFNFSSRSPRRRELPDDSFVELEGISLDGSADIESQIEKMKFRYCRQ